MRLINLDCLNNNILQNTFKEAKEIFDNNTNKGIPNHLNRVGIVLNKNEFDDLSKLNDCHLIAVPKTDDLIYKLCKLESLQEEIRCPLEIVLGIMLKKIKEITVNYSDAGGYGGPYPEYITINIDGLYDDLLYGWVMETNLGDIPLKDYKVNWWLRNDRSE